MSTSGNASASSGRTMDLDEWTLAPLSPDETNGGGTAVVHAPTGDRHEYTFASSLVRNVPHPPFITQENWEAQSDRLTFREDDVFVTTYSKCGTTLAEQIVLLLLNGGKKDELDPLTKNTLDRKSGRRGKVWTEMAVVEDLFSEGDDDGDKGARARGGAAKACMGEDAARMSPAEFDALPAPRVLKTHAPPKLFLDRKERRAKVLYVTRNPFDACVSCYYHPKPGVSPQSTGMPFDAFCKLWLSDRVEFGGWIDHTRGWREECLRGGDKMLWISYEELVDAPIESIGKIASFLGVDAANDPGLIRRVAEGCNFDSVKKSAQDALANGAEGNVSHLRKGKVGDWRNHFSDELYEQFEREVRSRFGGDGLGLEYGIGQGRIWKLQEDKNAVGTDDSTDGDAAKGEGPPIRRLEQIGVRWSIAASDPAFSESRLDEKRMRDVHILGFTAIFYSLLQTALQYVSEFYADDLRDANGLSQPTNYQAISAVMANVFNGINAGLALGTAISAGEQIRRTWSGGGEWAAYAFFVSIVVEAFVTSGVMHSVAHRLFGATLNGNAYVEFFAHLGYTINVIASSAFLLRWLAPSYLRGGDGDRGGPGWRPRPLEVALAAILAVLAVLFTQRWVPFTPDPLDFDYDATHEYDEPRIVLLQRNIQGVVEGLLVFPSVLMLFALGRLWSSIRRTRDDDELKLSHNTYRVCILAVAVPLCLNWVHFRLHDDLATHVQAAFHWEHKQTIAAIRTVFHIPAWILAIARTHWFRLLTEQREGWPALPIVETICPGGEIFPFVMIFLYRATEGMTIALLPSFFNGGSSVEYFYLDVTENVWIAVTVLGMFLGNAIGAVALGYTMQKRGYRKAFIFICASFLVVLPLYMIPNHSYASFFALRSISALLFPGPVVLSKITQNTRASFGGVFKHIPMVTGLVWFNQGFWFGGVISNSSVWTPWNVFFTSAVVIFALFLGLFIAFVVKKETPVEEKDLAIISTTRPSIDSDDAQLSSEEGRSQAENSTVKEPLEEVLSRQNRQDTSLVITSDAEGRENANYEEEREARGSDSSMQKLRNSFVRMESTFVRMASYGEEDQPVPDSIQKMRNDFVRARSVGSRYLMANLGDEDEPTGPANEEAVSMNVQPPQKRNTLLLARFSSFANGASFACHISLLPIQVTKLVDLDTYEYTTIVSSLGSISTVLILLSFKWMASRDTSFSMAIAFIGHMTGTAVLCIPQIYSLPMGMAVSAIVISYGAIMLSFFVMNLSCEVSLGQKSLNQKKKDAAAGLQMGLIKSFLSLGKVCGAALVAFAYRLHPQLPLWILEALLFAGTLLSAAINLRKK